jgi:hypothetical protein
MLYPIYAAIKNQLTTADGEAVLKGIEWYNVQYEATIATTPRVFVEFPDLLQFAQLSKDARRAPVKVRLHVVTQAIPTADGVIDDATAQAHEAVAEMVYGAIDGYKPTGLSSLQLTGWQHWHKYKGWMVTFVEFTANKNL